MRKFNITVNGKSYEVEVEEVGAPASSAPKAAPKAPAAPAAAAPAPTAAPKAEAKPAPVAASAGQEVVEAPMPGNIWKVLVKEGQEVKEDDALLILEAMKMENVLTSPRDGIIKSISVSKNDTVDKNQLLIEFE